MRYLIAIGTMLFSSCALLPYPFDQMEYPSPIVESRVERTPPAARIRADSFREHSKQYKGQVVEITGKVTHIVNKGGAAAISLEGITCGFGRKQKSMVSTLRLGQEVALRGIVSDFSDSYITPCIFVK